jgi:CheY-like chemotaxis protein
MEGTQRRCLELAEIASHSLLDLVGNILDCSKIEADRLVLEYSPIDLPQSVEETVQVLDIEARRKNLELSLEIDAEVPEIVYGDQTRLRQVLTNLIGNAIKFTDAGKIEVTVSLYNVGAGRKEDAEILFSVSDTGCGFRAKNTEFLFERFTQHDSSITRRYGGSGLGLAICKGIVERMGGKIWAESEPDVGSTFYFTLPGSMDRRQEPRRVATTRPGAAPSGISCRILLAEDDHSVQNVMQIVLQAQGWEVQIVADGQEAIEAWQGGDFDLILMDLRMKRMDGLTATRKIRALEEEGEHIPIVGLTAHALQEVREQCLQAGMDEILTKPLKLNTLGALIGRLCAHSETPG